MPRIVVLLLVALALAGGLLFLIRSANHRRMPHWSVAALLFLVAGSAAYGLDAWFGEREAVDEVGQVMARMESDPVFSAVRASSPANHRELVAAIEASVRAPADQRAQRARDLVDPILRRHVRERESAMDDAMTSRLTAMVSEVVLKRADVDPAHCMPDTSAMSREQFVALMGRERATSFMVDLMRMDPAPDARVGKRMEIAAMVSYLMPEISRRAGLTPEQVTYGQADGVQTATTCRIMGGMLASLAALPPQQGAPLIRGLSTL